MRYKHYSLTILLTLMLVLLMSAAAFAEDSSFKGSCSYDGEDITSDFSSDEFAATVSGMEPGDTVDMKVTYKNDSDARTEWYMENKVLQTLEDAKDQAKNGGYTYILKNIGPDGTVTTLFDNTVGGENEGVDLEGLKQATNATEEYFFIQELKKGEKGTTTLHVEFDGETEVNDYMDTSGNLRLSYAVEEVATETKTKEVKKTKTKVVYKDRRVGSKVNTGDRNNLLLLIAVNAIAVVLLIAAIIVYRRSRREDGEEV